MKNINILILAITLSLVGCNDYIDLEPQNNLIVQDFYKTEEQFNLAINGCYAGMKDPLLDEWALTEIRSDNGIMNELGTSNSGNLELKDLDIFNPNTNHPRVYNYWLNTYKNIRNTNLIFEALNINYKESDGTLNFDPANLSVTESYRKKISAEASFARAYHYFNLVRLYGGVFLIHEVVTPQQSPFINRSSVNDIYDLIIADLKNAADNGITANFASIASSDRGKATSWAAKGLLAKVYLTLDRKADAELLLKNIVSSSGHSLVSTYANVFSVNNELNSEILFAIRYKSGGINLGSPLANLFAPRAGILTLSGNGAGFNGVTREFFNSFGLTDSRKPINAIVGAGSGNSTRFHSIKHIPVVALPDDSEADWPVLRYSDVLLMLAEAQGNIPASLPLINQVHVRAALPALTATNVDTQAKFEKVLADERRWELAQENQRWFDLLRFYTTFTTINAEGVMDNHFGTAPMSTIYLAYNAPTPTVAQLQANARPDKFLLPIPQQEIDTNTSLTIPQNPGY
jgi:starch-binding outer membrane protein, SusD/RagB family